MKKEDYNEVPVTYCSHCLSLSIKEVEGYDICQQCRGEEFEKTDITTWEKLFEEKYKEAYLEW